jgi:ribonucleoside-diphosphate reductase beta chain
MSQIEPILQENKNRFVIFPIKHHDIWEWYKKMEASFGLLKKSICPKI